LLGHEKFALRRQSIRGYCRRPLCLHWPNPHQRPS
jgi:hypothetical protein